MSETKKSKVKKATVKKETTQKPKEKKEKEVKKEEKITVKKETVKKKEPILNKKEQKWYNVLSKIIKVFTKIVRIILMIIAPFIFLAMLLIPIIFAKYEVNANIIQFGNVNMVIREDNIAIRVGDDVQIIDCDVEETSMVMEFFNNNSKTKLIAIAETSLLYIGVMLVLTIYILSYIEKIFGNFVNQSTPFIKENTQNIFMIGVMICIMEIIDIIASITSWLTFRTSVLDLSDIVVLLAIFVVYLVFKYGVGLQDRTDTKIYE